MIDKCDFNQEDYCIYNYLHPDNKVCGFKDKEGLCIATPDDLITYEEYQEMIVEEDNGYNSDE